MENIDHVFFINLEKRQDRLDHILKEFERMQFSNPPERFDAIPTEGFGILGCTISHCEVLKLAHERKYKNVLIFEDDFEFIIPNEKWQQILSNIFEAHVNYDVIMFSYNLKSYEDSDEYSDLYRIKDVSTASCYLVNGDYLHSLISLYERTIPLLDETRMHWIYANDVVWKELIDKGDRWFATKTRVGKQMASFSDHSEAFMDHGC